MPIGGEFCSAVALSGGMTRSALGFHVGNVVRHQTNKQMIGVNAQTVVALDDKRFDRSVLAFEQKPNAR